MNSKAVIVFLPVGLVTVCLSRFPANLVVDGDGLIRYLIIDVIGALFGDVGGFLVPEHVVATWSRNTSPGN